MAFRTIEHYKERILDPALAIDENSVMVLQNCGPKGYPGMAEVGNMGLPTKLLARSITVRISDARMSGTAYGTMVLQVCPEAAARGPLALVRDGDFIELDVAGAPAASGGFGRGTRAPSHEIEAAASRCQRRLPAAVHPARDAGIGRGGSGFSGRLSWHDGDARVALI